MEQTILITKGKPGSWYENEVGKKFTASETLPLAGYVCDVKTVQSDNHVTKKYFVNFEDAELINKKSRRRKV